MKRMILLIIINSLYSCTNTKVKIVEREKQIQNEIRLIDARIESLRVENDTMKQTKNDSIAGNWNEYFKKNKQLSDSAQNLEQQKKPLRVEYDSLELELKKY